MINPARMASDSICCTDENAQHDPQYSWLLTAVVYTPVQSAATLSPWYGSTDTFSFSNFNELDLGGM